MFGYNPDKAAVKYAQDKKRLKDNFVKGITTFIKLKRSEEVSLGVAIKDLEKSKGVVTKSIDNAQLILDEEK